MGVSSLGSWLLYLSCLSGPLNPLVEPLILCQGCTPSQDWSGCVVWGVWERAQGRKAVSLCEAEMEPHKVCGSCLHPGVPGTRSSVRWV